MQHALLEEERLERARQLGHERLRDLQRVRRDGGVARVGQAGDEAADGHVAQRIAQQLCRRRRQHLGDREQARVAHVWHHRRHIHLQQQRQHLRRERVHQAGLRGQQRAKLALAAAATATAAAGARLHERPARQHGLRGVRHRRQQLDQQRDDRVQLVGAAHHAAGGYAAARGAEHRARGQQLPQRVEQPRREQGARDRRAAACAGRHEFDQPKVRRQRQLAAHRADVADGGQLQRLLQQPAARQLRQQLRIAGKGVRGVRQRHTRRVDHLGVRVLQQADQDGHRRRHRVCVARRQPAADVGGCRRRDALHARGEEVEVGQHRQQAAVLQQHVTVVDAQLLQRLERLLS
mmetsp:Transcript_3030/g.8274  ORF Transcript_3030/g.8274 Transcript_3030/m.8274 type:complete len:349 (-) Transcript_3030:1022-2068(-)|eukprot:32725-Chlamydomonas_euryale.AAC.3